MSNLLELAVDLINDAKGGGDAKGKLYLLEQVKEIVFHRDKSLLKDIIPSILDFMVERSTPIKKYLISFVDDAMAQDSQLSFPYFMNLFNFLVSDSSDAILALLAKSYQKYYDKLVMGIVSMPIIAKAQGLSDPKQLWQILSTLTSRFNDLITSNRSDNVKANCLRLYESQMLFGMPNDAPAANADPRLAARKDPRLARAAAAAGGAGTGSVASSTATSTSKSSDDIPLHHPFISRNEIVEAAKDHFTRALLWVSKGGPQSHPFSPALMSVLGQVIANVAASRLKNATTAAKALLTMLPGKDNRNVCAEMSGSDRQNLARALHHLLRAAGAYTADPEGIMPKLRTAVTALEALGLDVSAGSAADASVLKKRGRGAAGGTTASTTSSSSTGNAQGEDEENDTLMEECRSSAVAAIDAAEQRMKSSGGFSDLDALLSGADDGADAISMLLAKVSSSKPTTKASVGIGSILISGDSTELAKDLAVMEDPASLNELKLVTTTAQGASAVTSKAESIVQTPVPPSADGYSELALCSIRKLLDSYNSIDTSNIKMLAPFSLMCVKMIVSMVLSEVDAGRAQVPVQVVAIVPTASAGRLSEDVPAHVMLPRCLWALLGFVLSPRVENNSETASLEFEEELQKKVQILGRICTALYEEILWEKQAAEEARAEGVFLEEDSILKELQAVYDALCVVAMSRMIQITRLRSSLAMFMLSLPAVPTACVGILKLLITTGTKGASAAAPPGARDRNSAAAAAAEAARNRGTRTEALQLMGQMVFSQDESAGRAALNHLLLACVAEDFELRTKVINLIVHEIVHIEDWCDEIVTSFALQAMIGAVGTENVRVWCESQPQPDLVVPEGEVVADAEHLIEEATPPSEEADAMEVEVEGVDSGAVAVEEGGLMHAPQLDTRSLAVAFAQLQSGDPLQAATSLAEVPESERESYAKRAVQLLSQLCLVDLPMLAGFVDLHSVWANTSSGAEGSSAQTTEEAASESMGETGSESSGVNEISADGTDTVVANKTAWTLPVTLRAELRNILPAISQSNTYESIFDTLALRCDRLTWPLLEYSLNLLLSDLTVPASLTLIQRVRAFVLPTHTASEISQNEEEGQGAATEEKESMQVEELTANTGVTISDVTEIDAFKLMLPLVGGISTSEVEAVLPRIVGLFEEDLEGLNKIFARITKARPPPLTKAALLVALHRIDFEAQGLKPKSLLDAINVCLNNKSDFSGEVLKEALKIMLAQEVPPTALMRTAILSAQQFSEVKRFLLSDVIPHLVRKRVWSIAPKLWDGVVFGVKKFATSDNKTSELTLRGLLGVPAPQLRGLLEVAPDIKPMMGKLLKTLSADEKHEVISGRWVGLLEGDMSAEAGTLSEDKSLLIKEIAATATI